MVGTRLGPYEITAKLGEGGMGEVWRATDPRLRRDVAIKVLPAAFVADGERLARFEREAQLLAQLQHPNIAAIYGFEESGGTRALVMELVEGEDLAARIARAPLSLEEAVAIARQIAEALEAAHEQGIVHRDLKPANVKVRADGTVKVLDFGLAKALEPPGGAASGGSVASPALMDSPTLTAAPGTQLGVILGTAAYMAPEQARGGAVDKRADVWAFGVVLFEMLTGRRLFAGETVSDTLAAVLRDEVDLGSLPAAAPAELRRLLRRCLERNPKLRLRDVGEARIALDAAAAELLAPRPAGSVPPAGRRWAAALPWAVVALLAAALVWTGQRLATGRGAPAERASRVLAIHLPGNLGVALDDRGLYGQTAVLTVAPDGERVAFVAGPIGRAPLQLRELGSPEVRALPGTEGASSPFFSPDSRWIGYFSPGKLRKIAVAGGRPVDLASASLDRGGVWCPDGSIVYSPNAISGLWRVPAGGGTAVQLTTLDVAAGERTHRWPAVLPGGREVAFTVGMVGQPGDYDDARIDAVELATGRRRPLFRGASMVRFTPVGVALLGRAGQVLALPFDGSGPRGSDEATMVLDGIAGVPASGVLHFDVAHDGTLVYAERDARADELELAWFARDGTVTPLDQPPARYRTLRLSPEGRRAAIEIGPGGGRGADVAVLDFATNAVTRLSDDNRGSPAVWSRDGATVSWISHLPSAGQEVRRRPADGSAPATTIATFRDEPARELVGWMPDGSLLYWQDSGANGGPDLFYLPPGGGAPRPFATTAALEFMAAISPDGRYVAYVVDATGRPDLQVQPFPPTGAKWVVAEGIGIPLWSADGSELYFTQARTMMAVPVTTAGTFGAGAPRRLFDLPASAVFSSDTSTTCAVAPDGRFLTPRSTSPDVNGRHLVVVLDWFTTLGRLGSATPAGE